MRNSPTSNHPRLDVNAMRVWKTIRLGVHNCTGAYRKTLRSKNINISIWANDAIGGVDIAKVQLDVALVRVSAAELGFTKAVRRDAIYDRALSIGLQRCAPEVGMRLREEYLNQPIGEWLLIGMEPVVFVANSYPEFFVLERKDDGLLWLNSFWAISGHLWSPESQWVFTL